jgi:hypothetical protein
MSAAQSSNDSTKKGCIRIDLEELDEWDVAMLKKDMELGVLSRKFKQFLEKHGKTTDKEIDVRLEIKEG